MKSAFSLGLILSIVGGLLLLLTISEIRFYKLVNDIDREIDLRQLEPIADYGPFVGSIILVVGVIMMVGSYRKMSAKNKSLKTK